METQAFTSSQQNAEEKKQNESLQSQQNELDTNENQAETEAKLVSHIDKLFEIETLKHHHYLLSRLDMMNMHIPLKFIVQEKSVQAISNNNVLIESAVKKCRNLDFQNGPFVKLRVQSKRDTVLVKGIQQNQSLAFKRFIEDLFKDDEKTKQFKYEHDSKTDCVTLTYQDESSAVKVFSELLKRNFQEKPIDCMIKDSSSFIELLESQAAVRRQQPFYPYGQGYFKPQMMPYMGYQPNYPMMGMPTYNPYNKYPNYNKRNRDTEGTEGQDQGQDYPRRNYPRKYNGPRDGQREGGDRRQNKRHNQKKVLSKEEIEKVTSVDQDNYPPLA